VAPTVTNDEKLIGVTKGAGPSFRPVIVRRPEMQSLGLLERIAEG
jgi:hypothetical protein